MKARSLFTAVASVAILAVTLYAAEGIDLKGIKCAANGKGAAKDVEGSSLAYKGGKIYFCCANCPKAFTKKVIDADKPDALLAARGNAQLVATKQAKQSKCPVSGAPCKADQSIKVAGAAIHFCCPNCKGKLAKLEGEEQLLAAFGDAAFKKAAFKVGEDKE